MPKRPPRQAHVLAAPPDLRAMPSLALTTTLGQLWRADAIDFLRSHATGSLDVVFADPPYAIGKARWDMFESEAAYVDWCDAWLAEVVRVLAPTGSAYVCGFSEILAEIKARSAKRFAACRWLVWSYRNKANLGSDWGRSHESILHLRNSPSTKLHIDDIRIPYNEHTTRYPSRTQAASSQYGAHAGTWQPHPLGAKPRDVLEFPVLSNGTLEKTVHPTQKPAALVATLLRACSQPGQLICDPFVGSGTTAVVAEQLGRRWRCADADAGYVGLARDRLMRLTPGDTAAALSASRTATP